MPKGRMMATHAGFWGVGSYYEKTWEVVFPAGDVGSHQSSMIVETGWCDDHPVVWHPVRCHFGPMAKWRSAEIMGLYRPKKWVVSVLPASGGGMAASGPTLAMI